MKKYFYGKEIELDDNGDYKTNYEELADYFLRNCILNNEIYYYSGGFDRWELVNGGIEDEDLDYSYDDEDLDYSYDDYDIYQWFIIDKWTREFLCKYTEELVYDNEELNMTLWGVTHYGTPWEDVPVTIHVGI